MKKLLITGVSGFLGNCLVEQNLPSWKLYGLYNNNPVKHTKLTSLKTDITNSIELKKIFQKIQPDAVIHLGAMSNANFCETNEAISKSINVDASVQLAEHCKNVAIPFIFSSTDLVFDGEDGPYKETSIKNPISIYGKHKALAEELVLKSYPEACIARFPVMFGLPDWGNSFMSGWLNNLKTGKQVFAFTDEFRTKVSGKSAVEGLLLLLNKKAKGIWHLGGKERISRFDFAVKMAKAFDLPVELIQASKQADVKMAAARPSDVSLDSTKAFELGYDPISIEKALKVMFLKNNA